MSIKGQQVPVLLDVEKWLLHCTSWVGWKPGGVGEGEGKLGSYTLHYLSQKTRTKIQDLIEF